MVLKKYFLEGYHELGSDRAFSGRVKKFEIKLNYSKYAGFFPSAVFWIPFSFTGPVHKNKLETTKTHPQSHTLFKNHAN